MSSSSRWAARAPPVMLLAGNYLDGKVTEIRDKLEAAQHAPAIVRVTRGSFETEGEIGYVVALDADLLLLLCISNDIRFNGFAVLRIEDISDLEAPHDHADFVEEALRLRGESVGEAPAVALMDMGAAVRTAGQLFPLVALHRETVDPGICHIGRVVSVSPDSISVIEIDPDAEWDEEASSYPLPEITRVDFGGGYEEALALVGGSGPPVRHLRPVP